MVFTKEIQVSGSILKIHLFFNTTASKEEMRKLNVMLNNVLENSEYDLSIEFVISFIKTLLKEQDVKILHVSKLSKEDCCFVQIISEELMEYSKTRKLDDSDTITINYRFGKDLTIKTSSLIKFENYNILGQIVSEETKNIIALSNIEPYESLDLFLESFGLEKTCIKKIYVK